MNKRGEILACALTWEPGVRLIGDVTAAEIVQVCIDAESAEAKLATVQGEMDKVRAGFKAREHGGVLISRFYDAVDALLPRAEEEGT